MAEETEAGASESEQPDDRTIQLAYDLLKDIPARQMEAVDAVDGKAVQTFARRVSSQVSLPSAKSRTCAQNSSSSPSSST